MGGEEGLDILEEFGEEARKYLDHTGLGEADHTNSEIRRKCAFLIMAYTDHPLYANYASRANRKRSDDQQISVDKLENLPGVGAAPARRNRTSIRELADEQQAVEAREHRVRRSVADKSLPGKESDQVVNNNADHKKNTVHKKGVN